MDNPKHLVIEFYGKIATGDLFAIQRLIWILTILLLAIYLSPYFILGSQNKWMVWDNLDSSFVWYKILIESGALFAPNDTIVFQPLGGLPRGTLPSEFDAFVWLYKLFGPELAYILNRMIMTLVGFIGMYLLLSRKILNRQESELISIGVGLCFALLPFWPFGGLSIAGQPLVLYALLNIRKSDHSAINWMIVIIFPFYSSLVWSGAFFLVMVSTIWLYDTFRGKRSLALFYSLIVVSVLYIFANYRLFIDFLMTSDFVSHRTEFRSFGESTIEKALRNSASLFYRGHANAISLHSFVILPLIAVTTPLILFSKLSQYRNKFIAIGICIVFISLFHGFKEWPPLYAILKPIYSVLPIQLDRFYWLGPMLWLIIFGIALANIVHLSLAQPPQLRRILRIFVIFVVCVQVIFVACNHELIINKNSPTVEEFFAKNQFNSIKKLIGKPEATYRVASVGIHPSVALFNGLYTVDGYFINYPLSYKRQFRKVIAGEISKDESLRQYFDYWGSRVYMYNAVTKTNMVIASGSNIILRGVTYDWSAFYDLGGRYVLSAIEIKSNSTSQLSFVRKFSDPKSAWDVYLYQVQKLADVN